MAGAMRRGLVLQDVVLQQLLPASFGCWQSSDELLRSFGNREVMALGLGILNFPSGSDKTLVWPWVSQHVLVTQCRVLIC